MFSISTTGRVALLAAVLGLAACGRGAVPADDIEKEIDKLVVAAEGHPAEAVDCPEPLPAKMGSSIRCMVTVDGGRTYGVTVKVRSIEGQKTNYDIEVDETPTT